VEQFVNERIAGIVLAPLDYDALVRPVSTATSRNIPVVIMDSALKGEAGKDFVSFVATNNRKGGSLGAERLARLIGGKGKVVMLRYMVGSASTMEREEGFLETIAKHPGIQVTVSNRYAGATSGDAKTASMNMIDRIKQADGIFCSNESATFGMLLALRQSHYTRKVRFVGFDTSPQLIEGLEKGEIDALVAQNPTFMGYEAVKTLVNHLRGMKVDTNIDTGVEVVSQENLNTAAVKALLGR
jgi:ribose transport system substrate-binding protein